MLGREKTQFVPHSHSDLLKWRLFLDVFFSTEKSLERAEVWGKEWSPP